MSRFLAFPRIASAVQLNSWPCELPEVDLVFTRKWGAQPRLTRVVSSATALCTPHAQCFNLRIPSSTPWQTEVPVRCKPTALQPGVKFAALGEAPVIALSPCFSLGQALCGTCPQTALWVHARPCPWVQEEGRSLHCCCVSASTLLRGLRHDTFQNAFPALLPFLPPTSVPLHGLRNVLPLTERLEARCFIHGGGCESASL